VKKYKVLWSEAGEKDLLQIIAFLAADNPGQALKKLREIKRKAGDPVAFPERGRIVPELLAQGILVYRELVVPPWRILYRIVDNRVFV
jgi:toxin ParE1/3/4